MSNRSIKALYECYIEAVFVLRHKVIQLVQIDDSKNRAYAASLGCAGISSVVLPLFHISGPEEFPDKSEEIFVLNPFPQEVHHNMMVEAVKTCLKRQTAPPASPPP